MRFYFSKNHPHKRVAPTPADSPSCLAQKSPRSLCLVYRLPSTDNRLRARGAQEEKQEKQEKQGKQGFLSLLSLLFLLSLLSSPPLFTGIKKDTREQGGAHHNFQLLQQPRLVEDDDLFDEFIFALSGVVLLFEVCAEDACNGIPKLGRELATKFLQNLI